MVLFLPSQTATGHNMQVDFDEDKPGISRRGCRYVVGTQLISARQMEGSWVGVAAICLPLILLVGFYLPFISMLPFAAFCSRDLFSCRFQAKCSL
jgi:hypothetical protein